LVVSGQVMAPDGETPLSFATVYVGDNSAANRAAQTDACAVPSAGNFNYVCADEEGRFSITVDFDGSEAETLYFEKGAFLFTQSVSTSSSDAVQLGVISMATDAAKIAVVTGDYDNLEYVVANSGFGTLEQDPDTFDWVFASRDFDIYSGYESEEGYDFYGDLFEIDPDTSKATIFNYDIVLINCGVNEILIDVDEDEDAQSRIAVLRSFVAEGGRLVATDWSYDFVEQAFPEYIDFFGDDGLSYDQPESLSIAEVGEGAETLTAQVNDSQLAAFLGSVACSTDDGTCIDENNHIVLHHLSVFWSIMNEIHSEMADSVTDLVSGDVDIEGEIEHRVLTVLIEHGEGAVLFSSYHVEEEDFTPGEWTAQERIIQYLLLQ